MVNRNVVSVSKFNTNRTIAFIVLSSNTGSWMSIVFKEITTAWPVVMRTFSYTAYSNHPIHLRLIS